MANTQGIKAGRAFVELFADDSRLVRGLRAAEAKLKAFGQSVMRMGAVIVGLGSAVTAPMLAAVKVFESAGGAMNDLSQRTGVPVEALSELGYAAQRSGSDINALGNALFRMRRRVTYSGQHAESASSATWDINSQSSNRGVSITLQTGSRYDPNAATPTLYAYLRTFSFDASGHLTAVGPESRVVIDTPENCS